MESKLFTKYSAWKFGIKAGDIIRLDNQEFIVKIKENSSPYGLFREDTQQQGLTNGQTTTT
jgi:hypothetical protein